MDDVTGSQPEGLEGSWSTRQLGEFVAHFTSIDDRATATARMVERAAEVLDAQVGALIERGRIIAGAGPVKSVQLGDLRAVASGRRSSLELPGLGTAHALGAAAGEDGSRHLVVARTSEPFAPAEVELLRGFGRVLALGLRALGLVDMERTLRASSEAQASENASLLEALRGRQAMLERLSEVQRSIVSQAPLHEIFDQLVGVAGELIDDEGAMIRLRDRDGSPRSTIVASAGVTDEFLEKRRRSTDPGLGARALEEGRLVVADKHSDPLVHTVPRVWRGEGLHAGMAAPVFQRSEVVGAVVVASRDPNRAYSPREQQAILALAEHASLALNHARALDDAAHGAFYDGLTGMPNRALFLDRLEHAVTRARRSGVPVGVLFVDLDDFKTVNDSLGHSAGDGLLCTVGARLASCLRPSDTIARLGGDEFAILIEEIPDPSDAATAARRMLEALADPISVDGREIFVTASIGIAAGDDDHEDLLRDADLAMYRAKAEGKGRYRAYAPHMHTEIVDRLELEVDLKRAIERSELELYYQPIFSLRSGRVCGLEALVRWNHPTRGLVPPDRFIPMAEASGKINELGRWVLNAACHQGALWRARYPAMPGIQVGVNISSAQLLQDDLPGQVAEALRSAQLDPGGLTLEVTESVLMDDFDAAAERLGELKALGLELAVDDFGVGHSSLRYLKGLPIDNLKIAKPFIDEIGMPDPSPPILRAILELADVFDLRVVAEGIERPEQGERLLELGCELGQGHLLSKPVSASVADDLILSVGLLGVPSGPAERTDGEGIAEKPAEGMHPEPES